MRERRVIPWITYVALIAPFILCGCHRSFAPVRIATEQSRINGGLTDDPALSAMLLPYREQLSAEMAEVIGRTDQVLTKARPESTLGNWMADVLAHTADELTGRPVDLAYQNYGGIRITELPAGDLTRGKLFELMPFDNMLVVVSLDSAHLHRLFDHFADRGGSPVSHHVRMEISDGHAIRVRLQNEPIQGNRTYRVAMPDYIARGGDGLDFLQALPQEHCGILVRDALIRACVLANDRNQPIQARLEGRTTIKP